MTPEAATTSTVHTAAIIAVLAAVRHETHAENHLNRTQVKALTHRDLSRELRAATDQLNKARQTRRNAVQNLDDLEHRQAQRKHGRPFTNRDGDDAA